MTVEEVLNEVGKDRLFYKNSGGGVTLSGGEVLRQSKFAREILKRCRREDLHTVLDTAGAGSWKELESLLPLVDLLLFDLKHLDSEEHRRTTGWANQILLENLERASEKIPVWLRLPLIYGFNDSKEYMEKVVDLAKKIKVEKISLLPYHEGGKSKCEQLGRTYPMPEARAPEEDQIKILKELLGKRGVTVSIGN
jgi:pyruvate formate lyase activating enzyme